ncbi:MAG TPA: polysaccharide lyase family 8 super-sandwich domain-containing protein [Opitutaceae bacterium]|nr:polysaccharide lyase family 8 super-sandwich domain-containing protein [Opitutaceae bacterium]
MRPISLFVLLVALSLVAQRPLRASPSDLDRARRQFCEFYLGSDAAPAGNVGLRDTNERPPDTSQAAGYVRSLRADGSWSDIDYDSPARSGWPPALHWTRMLAIVAAENLRGAHVDVPAFNAAIHRAFAYWIHRDCICRNWWYNQIGIPKLAGTTALLFGNELTPAERHYLLAVMMPRAKIAMTGQNRVWLSGNTVMAGLLEGDEAKVAEAASTIWSEVAVTTEEGIQPDFSFHQHGPQQQFGNYGLSLAVEVCRWGTVLRGTPWAMPAAKLAVYRRFLLEGESWMVWKGWMDVSSCDRQLMPHSQVAKARTVAQVMQNAIAFDPAGVPGYERFVRRNTGAAERNDLVGNQVFWRSDYVIHRRPDWAATLKLSSRRVIGAEMVNTENRLGYHLADGALYLYRRGDEYRDIFPVWDWQKLPGVTCAQLSGGPPPYQHVRGEREFVGGVSDGELGCAALDFARDGVTARKAWFFGRDEIVCLGVDITGPADVPVVTTVNQSRVRGPVMMMRSGHDPERFAGGDAVISSLDWVSHDGWYYTFITPTTVHLRTGPQTGNWNRVFRNPETPKADVTEDVFALWIDHGVPSSGRYAYVITPGQRPPNAQPIVSNTSACQFAVLGPTTTAAVFWKPGEIRPIAGQSIAVNRPCLLVCESDRIFVSDPTQTLASLSVTVNGKTIDVLLPQGGEAGRTVEVRR